MEVEVIAVKQPGERNCACFVEKSIGKVGLTGYGATVDAALKDMLVARQEAIETGEDVPELKMTFKYDLWAFFDKFPLNATMVARQIGINPSLMRQYLAGIKKPSKKRIQQIEEAVRQIGKQIAGVTLVNYD